MADQRIGYSEEMVGSGHPTKADTLNRLALVEHNTDGTHDLLTKVTDPWVDVRAFGAVGDGVTDDTVAIQAAIDSITEGVVFLPTGVWGVTGLLSLPSRVVVQGMGSRVTELKLLDGSDADCVMSKDFSTLTGTNKWLTADGVPYAFGLRGVRINGNKANNTAGYGVKFYGKRFVADDVLIYNCAGVGWYSECAAATGQSDYTDMPESRLTLDVRNCDGDNVVFRGSHDSIIRELISCYSGGAGVKTERLTGTYDGNVNIVSAEVVPKIRTVC